MSKMISISRDGVWAGNGAVVDGIIQDCAAILGANQDASEETYEAIEQQIADDKTDGSVSRPDGTYSWRIEESDPLVCGKRVQIDRSGVGHAWRNQDADDIWADVREEIAAEILDGGNEECDDYVATNGMHYRWFDAK